jgi:hypothetical protein
MPKRAEQPLSSGWGLERLGMKCGSYRYWIRLDTFLKIGKNHARSGSVAVQFWTHVVSRE